MPKPKKKSTQPAQAAATALAAAAAPAPTPGAIWSNNNKACNKTWWWLNFLKQIDAAFPVAGNIKMKKLAYWDDTASEEEQRAEAAGIADMMIKGFTQLNGATYEPTYNYAAALLAMTTTLRTAEKTVAEFAAVNDELFHFFNE
jgi:hypothetical protein